MPIDTDDRDLRHAERLEGYAENIDGDDDTRDRDALLAEAKALRDRVAERTAKQ